MNKQTFLKRLRKLKTFFTTRQTINVSRSSENPIIISFLPDEDYSGGIDVSSIKFMEDADENLANSILDFFGYNNNDWEELLNFNDIWEGEQFKYDYSCDEYWDILDSYEDFCENPEKAWYLYKEERDKSKAEDNYEIVVNGITYVKK